MTSYQHASLVASPFERQKHIDSNEDNLQWNFCSKEMFLCGFDRCLPCDKIYTWKPNTSIIKLKHTHFDKLSPQGCVGYKWRYDSFIDEECMNKFPSSKWNRSINLLVLHQSLIWCHLPNPPFALLHHISHTSMECAFIVDVTHIGHIWFFTQFCPCLGTSNYLIPTIWPELLHFYKGV